MSISILTVTTTDYHPFGTPEFNLHTLRRTKHLLDELKAGKTVFQLDSDVILFKDYQYFIDQLGELDMICQREHDNTPCGGFFVCRPNPTTIAFWEEVIEKMEELECKIDDQTAMRMLLQADFPISLGFFDPMDVTSYGLISGGGKLWEGQDFDIPKGIGAFHANYTMGLENKAKLLAKAKQSQDA